MHTIITTRAALYTLAIMGFIVGSPALQAEDRVTVNYTAVITNVNTSLNDAAIELPEGIQIGDEVSGRLTFDADADPCLEDASYKKFSLGQTSAMTLSVGSHEFIGVDQNLQTSGALIARIAKNNCATQERDGQSAEFCDWDLDFRSALHNYPKFESNISKTMFDLHFRSVNNDYDGDAEKLPREFLLEDWPESSVSIKIDYDDGSHYLLEADIKSIAGTTTSLGEGNASEQVKVYPNPANDIVLLQFDDSAPVRITLRDVLGAVVLARSVNVSPYSIDLSTLATGSYFVTLESRDGVLVKPLSIVR